jgi:hypothetical protein
MHAPTPSRARRCTTHGLTQGLQGRQTPPPIGPPPAGKARPVLNPGSPGARRPAEGGEAGARSRWACMRSRQHDGGAAAGGDQGSGRPSPPCCKGHRSPARRRAAGGRAGAQRTLCPHLQHAGPAAAPVQVAAAAARVELAVVLMGLAGAGRGAHAAQTMLRSGAVDQPHTRLLCRGKQAGPFGLGRRAWLCRQRRPCGLQHRGP